MANEFPESREGTANSRHANLTSSLDLSTSLDHSVQTRIFKIIVIGDSNVGKTCLTFRFTGGAFPCKTEATIGVEFREKAVEIEGEKIKVGFIVRIGLVTTRPISRCITTVLCVFQWKCDRQQSVARKLNVYITSNVNVSPFVIHSGRMMPQMRSFFQDQSKYVSLIVFKLMNCLDQLRQSRN